MKSIFVGRRGATLRHEVVIGSAVVLLSALPVQRAWAGVEYATNTNDCQTRISSSGTAFTLMAGPNVRFEVWGNSVDLADPTSGFQFAGPAGMQAHVVTRRSGPTNLGRGCGNVGSAVIEVDSPPTLGANASSSVSFKMPLGDMSTQHLTILTHPVLNQATWTNQGSLLPNALPCIVGTGTIAAQNQDTKLVIQLPPGAAQDQSTCTSNKLAIRISVSATTPNLSVPTSITYRVSGLPSFVTVSQPSAPSNVVSAPELDFTFNVAGIRALSAASNSTIKITNPIDTLRSTSLVLQVTPTPGQGFSQVASANPSTTNAGNPIDITLHFSAPTVAGAAITWRMTQAACFAQAITQAPYNPSATFQIFRLPGNQTSAIIRVLSVNGATCANRRAPTTHIFEAWIGDVTQNPQVTAVTSGPTYTRTNVALNFP